MKNKTFWEGFLSVYGSGWTVAVISLAFIIIICML